IAPRKVIIESCRLARRIDRIPEKMAKQKDVRLFDRLRASDSRVGFTSDRQMNVGQAPVALELFETAGTGIAEEHEPPSHLSPCFELGSRQIELGSRPRPIIGAVAHEPRGSS